MRSLCICSMNTAAVSFTTLLNGGINLNIPDRFSLVHEQFLKPFWRNLSRRGAIWKISW